MVLLNAGFLHRAAYASPQYGSCVLTVSTPTDEKWKLSVSQGLSRETGTVQLPSLAVIGQAATEFTEFPPLNKRNVKEFAAIYTIDHNDL